MKNNYDHGIFYGAVRSFFVVLMATIGFALGIFCFLFIMGGISSSAKEPERSYKMKVLPNAEGIRKIESGKSPVILQININGVIGTELLNTQNMEELLIESREGDLKDNRVKAILLNISTPGGTFTDSDGIYRALKLYKERYKVPVYAFADGLCASGGMYVACAADKIFSNDATLIGSVGVIGPSFMNFSKLIDVLGVQALTISEGKGKDDMNPLRPWRPDEDAMYKNIIKYYYGLFVDIVATARPRIGKENLIDKYGAGMFPAAQAKEIGYIDESNFTREGVLKQLLKEVSIEDDYYQVVVLENTNWISKIFSSQNNLFQGKISHKLELPEEMDPNLSGKVLCLYRP